MRNINFTINLFTDRSIYKSFYILTIFGLFFYKENFEKYNFMLVDFLKKRGNMT